MWHVACGIFPGQRSNPCLPQWQAESLPLSNQGNLLDFFLIGQTPLSIIQATEHNSLTTTFSPVTTQFHFQEENRFFQLPTVNSIPYEVITLAGNAASFLDWSSHEESSA